MTGVVQPIFQPACRPYPPASSSGWAMAWTW